MRPMECEQNGCLKALLLGAAVLCLSAVPALGQQFSNFRPEDAKSILDVLKGDIRKNYYDPSFHAADLDQMFQAAQQKLKTATSAGQLMGIIAQTLVDLNDSHTFFLPPERSSRIEYGWQMQMIGDQCFVTAVKPASDADLKGLKPGDAIALLDGYEPDRESIWKMKYALYSVRPQPLVQLTVKRPDNQQRDLKINAKITQERRIYDLNGNEMWELIREEQSESRLYRHRFQENGELYIWKMPAFDLSESEVDDRMDKIARSKTLILDLRGNGGGSVATLKRLAGYFFDHDVKIADLKGRKKMDPMLAKSRGKDMFTGKLIVLVDSGSASASEIFARLMQLEKRGVVIGDRTAGAVMQSERFSHKLGTDRIIPYGASITNADVIMSDGESLENRGVTPNAVLIPTGEDLASGRDPVLAYAAGLLGVQLTPEQAGKMFPIEWRN